jgi:hypothetical protein
VQRRIAPVIDTVDIDGLHSFEQQGLIRTSEKSKILAFTNICATLVACERADVERRTSLVIFEV